MQNCFKRIGNRKSLCCIAMLLVSVVFYLLWYWCDGIIITPDAQSYIGMSSAREPGYSVFLWICRLFAGEDGGLALAVILQCLLAAVAACALVYGLQKRFSFNWVVSIGILLIQYGITLLNRFVAQRRYSYYNSIETEALTYSIWVFFVLSLLGIIYDKDKKSIITAVLYSVILMSMRKQLLICFAILFLCLVFVWWKEKKWIKAIGFAFVIVILGIVGTRLLDCTYNLAVRGVFAPHTGDSSFVLGTVIYVADEDMAEKIESDENREVFLEIIRRAKEQGYNSRYAGEGWQNIEDHYSASYDPIKFSIVNVVIREKQDIRGIADDIREADRNRIMSELVGDLLVSCLPGMFKIFCSNLVHGAVTTVLKTHAILNWIALGFYIFYIGLGIWLIRMRSYQKVQTSVILFAALVLVGMAINIGATSAIIYPQMRYMLYNTGLFYQAGLLMLYEAWRTVTKK